MFRFKFEALKRIFTSKYWLVASLSGAFFSFFALNRGGVVVFVDACLVFLLVNFISGTYRLRDIPLSFRVTAAICAYLLIMSILLYPKESHYRWMAFMIRMLVVVFAIHCLSLKSLENWVVLLFFSVLSAAVIWQFAAIQYYNMRWGTFSNPHYLSSFSALALPAIVYYSFTANGWYKYLFVPIALIDFHMLLGLVITSRPALLGITAGGLFVLFFLTRGKIRWGSILAMCCILAAVLFTNYAKVYSRFLDLAVNLMKDERVLIWRDSWILLKENTFIEWIIGNGIGVFRTVYPEYHARAYDNLIFPHFFPLGILYDNGLIGLILFLTGTAALLISAIKAAGHSADKKSRVFVKYMIVIFLTWLIHAGLSFPFYSKYSQYSLAFILGPLLAVLGNPACQKDRVNVNQNESRAG